MNYLRIIDCEIVFDDYTPKVDRILKIFANYCQ